MLMCVCATDGICIIYCSLKIAGHDFSLTVHGHPQFASRGPLQPGTLGGLGRLNQGATCKINETDCAVSPCIRQVPLEHELLLSCNHQTSTCWLKKVHEHTDRVIFILFFAYWSSGLPQKRLHIGVGN